MDAITLQLGADGIAVATMDLPGRPMNVVNEDLMIALAAVVERLETDDAIKGPSSPRARPISAPAATSTASARCKARRRHSTRRCR
jgi:hypothetical protein